MEPDKFAMVDRILKNVDNILRKNLMLSSFDIVPVDSNLQNKSPVLLHRDCLALESWCVKHVFIHCYSQLVGSRPKYSACEDTISLLNAALLIHPDVSSLWNRRREMMLKGVVDARSELRFTKLVLSRKAKCNDAFAYRRWILDDIIKDTVHGNSFPALISEEMDVCTVASDKCPNNYHSWNHRIWLIRRLQSSPELPRSMLHRLYVTEYKFSEQFTLRHISDHSCFHYRQFCIQNVFTLDSSHWKEYEKEVSIVFRMHIAIKMISESIPNDTKIKETDLLSYSEQDLITLLLGDALNRCSCAPRYSNMCRQVEILFYELSLNDDMIRFYPNHETLWYHRRFIIHQILSIIYRYHGVSRKNTKVVKKSCDVCLRDVSENKAKIVCYSNDCVQSSILFQVLADHDKKVTLQSRTEGDNYADRHEKYMKFIEGVRL